MPILFHFDKHSKMFVLYFYRYWKPSPCLEEVIEKIEIRRQSVGLPKVGLALDLACGSGS
jgi:hypothetical protein